MPAEAVRRTDPARLPRVWTAADVAAVLRVPVERVVWHCERANALGSGALFFGAWMEDGGWLIPDRAARRAVETWPRQHYTLAEVASLTGFKLRTIARKVWTVPAGASLEDVPPGRLGAVLFFGTDLRVSGMELERLAAGLVGTE